MGKDELKKFLSQNGKKSHLARVQKYGKEYLDKMREKSVKATQKPVDQCDMDGRVLRRFNSISAASRTSGISASAIHWSINEQKPTRGYVWKRKEH